ncbi:hypothetical protein [Neobacillus mesonae]|nr:hypothetical protein [Neobacillus mesonae]
MFNQSLNALRETQQEENQWKKDVFAILKSIDDKLGKLLEGK